MYIPYNLINVCNNEMTNLETVGGIEKYYQNGYRGKIVLENQYLTGTFDLEAANDANIEKELTIKIRVYGNTWCVTFGNYKITCNNQLLSINNIFMFQLDYY